MKLPDPYKNDPLGPRTPSDWRDAAEKYQALAKSAAKDGDEYHADQAAALAAACRQRAREMEIFHAP